jgi:hypothetical protein
MYARHLCWPLSEKQRLGPVATGAAVILKRMPVLQMEKPTTKALSSFPDCS